MTARETLSRAREILTTHNIKEPSLESELLLRHTLKVSRAELYRDFNRRLSPEEEAGFWDLIERRLKYEPTAYITGHREFYGLDFYVDPSVLIPRPESELLVEKALGLAHNRPISSIAEVGTGCGAIAISLALNLPRTEIYATDISAPALRVARLNCQRHGVNRINLLLGDMLTPLPGPVELIVANLPYVREAELAGARELSFEPSLALDGGRDGLEKIRRLCAQAGSKLRPGGGLLLEMGQGQEGALTALLHRLFPSGTVELTPDLGGIGRVVSLTLP